MINLYNWYVLPNSELISGDILANDGVYTFKQEKITKVEAHGDGYIVNNKYILEKTRMDSFFKEPSRLKRQIDFIENSK